MTLKEFIENFVCHNSLIKLWKPIKGGHELLVENEETVCMEWQIIKGSDIWQNKYADVTVIGVTDILCDDHYREAINIVIDV